MAEIYVPVGVCAGCDSDVLNDDQGRTLDADRRVWHTDCRKVELRKQSAPPRRGRPPKPAATTEGATA